MCRLLYLPANVRPARKVLTAWLRSLERSNGGHGNGYATPNSVRKGVTLTASECSRRISKVKAPVIWHTRRISCGPMVDGLCHPFEASLGYLVHNGHWQQGAFTASLLDGQWSDTRVAALYISRFGWEAFTGVCSNGVWLYLSIAGCAVHYASGSLYVEQETGALCSEPCSDWGYWSPAEQGTYAAGERVKAKQASTFFKGMFDRDGRYSNK